MPAPFLISGSVCGTQIIIIRIKKMVLRIVGFRFAFLGALLCFLLALISIIISQMTKSKAVSLKNLPKYAIILDRFFFLRIEVKD